MDVTIRATISRQSSRRLRDRTGEFDLARENEKGPKFLGPSCSGAEGGIRTPTLLRAPAPQAGASASSATSARGEIIGNLRGATGDRHLRFGTSINLRILLCGDAIRDRHSLNTSDLEASAALAGRRCRR